MNDFVRPEVLTSRIELGQIDDPVPDTPEYSAAWQRVSSAAHLTAMPWLPQLPDEWATEIWERIDAAERQYVAPTRSGREYLLGTANYDDEIALVEGQGTMLFTAEHATKTIRAKTGAVGFADTGTAGLAAVLAEDYGRALIMLGRQTGNPATDPDHPIKAEISRHVHSSSGFLSVHGMNSGLFVRPTDTTEVQAIIGIGATPSESVEQLAWDLVHKAHDLGLYAIVGSVQPHYVQEPHLPYFKRIKGGDPYIGQLGALKPNSTINFAQRELQRMGGNVPAIQIELTHLLRATPEDTSMKDDRAEVVGVALGYKFLQAATELMMAGSKPQSETNGA